MIGLPHHDLWFGTWTFHHPDQRTHSGFGFNYQFWMVKTFQPLPTGCVSKSQLTVGQGWCSMFSMFSVFLSSKGWWPATLLIEASILEDQWGYGKIERLCVSSLLEDIIPAADWLLSNGPVPQPATFKIHTNIRRWFQPIIGTWQPQGLDIWMFTVPYVIFWFIVNLHL